MKKLIAALACTSGLALAGAAIADEPFRLGDAELDRVTAAGVVNFSTNVLKNVDIVVTVDLDIDKDVSSTVDVLGNLATAEASADAFGFDTLSETETFAQAVEFTLSQSFSQSTAAAQFTGASITLE